MKVTKGSVDPKWSAAEQVERARAATGRPWTSKTTDRELARMAQRFLTTNVKPGDDVPALPGRAGPVGPAPPAALRPRRLPLLRTDALRRLLPHRRRAPLAAARLPSAAGACCRPASARPSRSTRRARCRSRAPSRPPRPARRRRPNAPVLVNVFVPGGLDLLDTLVPGDAYGALRGPAPGAEGRPAGRAARHRLRRAPGAGGGAQRRPEGPLRPRPPGLHPGHRLRQPGSLALQQPALLGDRPRSRSTRRRGGWRAGPIATAGPTTRSRRCRWTPACRRCCAAATTRSPRCSRPTTPSRGCPACGASGRTA